MSRFWDMGYNEPKHQMPTQFGVLCREGWNRLKPANPANPANSADPATPSAPIFPVTH